MAGLVGDSPTADAATPTGASGTTCASHNIDARPAYLVAGSLADADALQQSVLRVCLRLGEQSVMHAQGSRASARPSQKSGSRLNVVDALKNGLGLQLVHTQSTQSQNRPCTSLDTMTPGSRIHQNSGCRAPAWLVRNIVKRSALQPERLFACAACVVAALVRWPTLATRCQRPDTDHPYLFRPSRHAHCHASQVNLLVILHRPA